MPHLHSISLPGRCQEEAGRRGLQTANAPIIGIIETGLGHGRPVDPILGAEKVESVLMGGKLNQCFHKGQTLQTHAPVPGADVQLPVLDRHPPEVAYERTSETIAKATEGHLQSTGGQARFAHDQVPTIVRIDGNEFAGSIGPGKELTLEFGEAENV